MSSSKQGNQRDKRRRTRDVQAAAGKKPERGSGTSGDGSGTSGDGSGTSGDGSGKPAAKTGPNPLVAGIKSTSAAAMRGIRKVSPPVAGALVTIARLVIAAVLWIAARLERFLRPVHRALGPITSAALQPVGRAVVALEKVATPRRAVATTAVFAAGCLVGSQFLDYSGVAIGGDQYLSVAALTSPPLKGVETPFGPHGPVVILLGIAALVLLGASLLRRDRRFALGASLAGLLSVLITLAIDLPAAADVGVLATQFEGTDSVLLTGFYAQLSAATILTLAGALLAIRTPAPIKDRQPRKESPPAVRANRPPGSTGQVKRVDT